MPNESKKSIMFLINSLSVGGAQRVCVDDANALMDAGWEVHVTVLFGQGAFAKELRIPQEHIHELNARSVFDAAARGRLKALLRNYTVERLYTTLNEANAFGRLAVLFMPSVALYTREANMASAKALRYRLLDILFGWRSKRIVAVSRAVADSVTGYAPWLRQKTTVLYNGTAIPGASVERPTSDAVRILTVGSLEVKKDQGVLLRACALLPPKFTLTVVGDGALRDKLHALANELGIQARVQFTGALDRQSVTAHYRTHDIFALPSRFEGCPNVVSEAQSFSLPVVAFAIPGMNEFVSKESGLLVQKRTPESLAEALTQAAEPVRRRVMGEAGFKEVTDTRSNEKHLQALAPLLW